MLGAGRGRFVLVSRYGTGFKTNMAASASRAASR